MYYKNSIHIQPATLNSPVIVDIEIVPRFIGKLYYTIHLSFENQGVEWHKVAHSMNDFSEEYIASLVDKNLAIAIKLMQETEQAYESSTFMDLHKRLSQVCKKYEEVAK